MATDLNRILVVVTGVLSDDQLATCRAALENTDGDPTTAGFYEGSATAHGCQGTWGQAWADLLEHPKLLGCLGELCGTPYQNAEAPAQAGHRLDVAPALLPTVAGGDDEPVPLTGGGGGDVSSRRVQYHHLHGQRKMQGVRVVWALADVSKGDGGLVLLPATHRSQLPTPARVTAGTHDRCTALLHQPTLAAGDLLLVASTTLRGLKTWQGAGPQLLWSCEYTAVGAYPSGGYQGCPVGTRLEPIETQGWVDRMSLEQMAVVGDRMRGQPAALAVTPETGAVECVSAETALANDVARDAAICTAIAEADQLEFDELWFWSTFGFLVVPNVMSQEWLADANAAIDKFASDPEFASSSFDLVHKAEGWPEGTSKRLQGGPYPVIRGLYQLPDPHERPFHQMACCAPVVQRLNWMMGHTYHETQPPTVSLMDKGEGGFSLHGGPLTNPPASSHYLSHTGRCHTEQVNLAYVLADVAAEDGVSHIFSEAAFLVDHGRLLCLLPDT